MFDLLTEFGKLRRKLREMVGYDVLSQEYWVHSMSEEKLLENLPKPHLGHSRLTGKTQPPVPPLGARKSAKPADWPRGPHQKVLHGVATGHKETQEHADKHLRRRPATQRRRPAPQCRMPAPQPRRLAKEHGRLAMQRRMGRTKQ